MSAGTHALPRYRPACAHSRAVFAAELLVVLVLDGSEQRLEGLFVEAHLDERRQVSRGEAIAQGC